MRKFFTSLLILTGLLGLEACSKSAALNAKGGAAGESDQRRPVIDTNTTGGIQSQGPGGSNQQRRRRR